MIIYNVAGISLGLFFLLVALLIFWIGRTSDKKTLRNVASLIFAYYGIGFIILHSMGVVNHELTWHGLTVKWTGFMGEMFAPVLIGFLGLFAKSNRTVGFIIVTLFAGYAVYMGSNL